MSKKYSLEYLKSISGGDEDFIKDMIQTFVNTVPEELMNIKVFIEEKNWIKGGENSHKFGSNLLYLELDELKEIIVKLENYGLEMEHIDEIPVLFDKLSVGCFYIIEELKRDFVFLTQ